MATDIAAQAPQAGGGTVDKPSVPTILLSAIAGILSGYFVVGASIVYWVVAAGGAVSAWIVPRALIQRLPLVWLVASTALTVALTQTIPGFFPDLTSARDIGLQLALVASLGLLARSYLVYTEYADTFDALKASMSGHPLERWLAGVLNHPIDAIFGRVCVANTLLMLPLTVLVILPGTFNYLVIFAHATCLLLGLFPQEIVEHQNTHTRVFSPKPGANERIKLVLKVLQFHFEYVLALLTARAPNFYRVQHVYVHHVEDNGPLDTHTTLPYYRTSFLDFSRHALWQSIDLVTGARLLTYLVKKGKQRQIRDVVRGLAAWWAFVLAVALINPLGALYLFVSRFVGGTYITLITFYQHGLVDPADPVPSHGHTTDFVHHDHGNLGFDYHVEHHTRPARHWTWYYEEHARLAGKDGGGHPAVIIEKEKFGPLAFMAALWRKDYSEIARYAHVHDVPNGNADALGRVLAERARPIGAPERAGRLARIDAVVSRAMAAALPKSFAV
jgi:Fatty acid desaturase